MRKLPLTGAQRGVLSEAFRDLATTGCGALLFGQFLVDRPVVAGMFIAGLAIWLILIAAAVYVAGDQ